jgi:hypothetical protein
VTVSDPVLVLFSDNSVAVEISSNPVPTQRC